jgi:hypothetical protein
MCPVCAYQFLSDDALNHDICPSCGTEFGYDDVASTHETLRMEWVRNGGSWFDRSMGPPADWDPISQVMAAFYRPRFASRGLPLKTAFQTDISILPLETPYQAGP